MTTTPEPSAHQAHQTIPPVPGKPAGKRWTKHLLWIVPAAVLLMLATVAVTVFALRDPAPEGFLAKEDLRTVKPLWSDDIHFGDGVVIHENLLVHHLTDDDEVIVRELGSGDTVWTVDAPGEVWLSGDRLVTANGENGEIRVHDLGSGKRERTIDGDIDAATVASDVLVVIDSRITDGPDSELVVRMRAVDIASGDELWSKQLQTDSQWDLRNIAEPRFETSGSFDTLDPSSSAPFVFLMESYRKSGLEDRVQAIDVATGQARWEISSDELGDKNPKIDDFQMLDDGRAYRHLLDTYTSAALFVDAETGETDTYPTPDISYLGYQPPLLGDLLTTFEGNRATLLNVATGETVWTSRENKSVVANGGDVVVETTDFPEDAANPDNDYQLSNAFDVETGDLLWARSGSALGEIRVVGDLMVGNAFAELPNGSVFGLERPEHTQVLDKRTGEGKWQLDVEAELVALNDDYFVFVEDNDDVDAEAADTLFAVPIEG